MTKEIVNRIANTLSQMIKERRSGCCNAPISYIVRAGRYAFGQTHSPKRVCTKCGHIVEHYWGEYDQETFQETGNHNREQ